MSFVFFRAENGIRDDLVTGVQTCALPILEIDAQPRGLAPAMDAIARHGSRGTEPPRRDAGEIGRASCRERVWSSVVDGSVERRKADSRASYRQHASP